MGLWFFEGYGLARYEFGFACSEKRGVLRIMLAFRMVATSIPIGEYL